MKVMKTEAKIRHINKAGKWHFKIIEIGERLTDKKNPYLRVTCITSDDRLFVFPIYTNENGMELIQMIARSIGYEHVTQDREGEVIDTNLFVGGFFHAIVSEYNGDNEAYESGYYITSVWASRRRYDKTGSSTFKRVRISDRGYSTYKSQEK
jgi:hypothetical protein